MQAIKATTTITKTTGSPGVWMSCALAA